MKKIIMLVLLLTVSVSWNREEVQASESSSGNQSVLVDETEGYKLKDFAGMYGEIEYESITVSSGLYELSYEDLEDAYPKLIDFLEQHEIELQEVTEHQNKKEIKETVIYGNEKPISPVNIVSSVPLFVVEDLRSAPMFYLFDDDFLYEIKYDAPYDIETFWVTKYERSEDHSDVIVEQDSVVYEDVLELNFETFYNFHSFTGVVELYAENSDLGYTYAHINRADNPDQKYLVGWTGPPDQEIELGDELRFTGSVTATTEILFEEGSQIVPVMDVLYVDEVE